MDLDMRQTLRGRPRTLCAPAVIGVLLLLGGCGGSGGDTLPSRTASAELPSVPLSIDRTEPATSTTVEAPTTEPTPARTPPIASTQPATTQVTTQTTQVTQTAEVTQTAQVTQTARLTETAQVTETSTWSPTAGLG